MLSLDGEQHPRQITLRAIGTEFTNWGAEPAYIARTHVLDQTLELWKPAREGDALPAGAHAFPFAVELPPDLPPTFEGMLTEIGYGLRAKVDLPRHIDLHAEAGFIVLAIVQSPEDTPVAVDASDESGRAIALELPRSAYRLGDAVSGTVRVVRTGEGQARRLTMELLSKERGSAQGVWTEHVEREADVRIELTHATEGATYLFTFTIPDSAVPSFSGTHSSLAWHVSARLNVARAQDLVAETEIAVVEID